MTEENRNNIKDMNVIRRLLYVLMLVVASMPLAADYILNVSGNVQWLAAVSQLAEGVPSSTPLQSRFWYYLPAYLLKVTGNQFFAYKFFLLLVQTATVESAFCLFRRIFREDTLACFLGTLLYVTCPYRLMVCYETGNINETIGWMLLPLYAYGCLQLAFPPTRQKNNLQQWFLGGVIAALSLAGIGLADNRMLIITVAFTALLCIFSGRPLPLAGAAAGLCLWLPFGLSFLRAVFFSGAEAGWIQPQFINDRGYSLGDFFTSYAYTPGTPGLGLGLLLGLAVTAWYTFTQKKETNRQKGTFKEQWLIMLGILALFLSLNRFPWDMVQRLGSWSLRFVSYLQTPAVFFGFGCFAFCIPAASHVSKAGRLPNKALATGIPLIVTAAAMGIAVYLCNSLTFNTEPLR